MYDGLGHDNLSYAIGQMSSSLEIYGDGRDAKASWDHQEYVNLGIYFISLAFDFNVASDLVKSVSKEIAMGAARMEAKAFIEDLAEKLAQSSTKEEAVKVLNQRIDDETLQVLKQGKNGVKFTDDELVDLVKVHKVNIIYLRLMIEDSDILKECPSLIDYVKCVYEETGSADLQKWLAKNIDGTGSVVAEIKAEQSLGEQVDSKLLKSKMGYLNNLKGGHGEYRAYVDLVSQYGHVEGLELKIPSKQGPDYVFKVAEEGQTRVKVVEVKARKSLSMGDIKNYVKTDKAGNPVAYNINYGVLHKGEDYFKNVDQGLSIDFELYLYGENSDVIATQMLNKMPEGTELPYVLKSAIVRGQEYQGNAKVIITAVKDIM